MATASGLQRLDLITLLQNEAYDKVVMTNEGAAGPVAISDSSVFCVISSDSCRLLGWTRETKALDVPLSGLRLKPAAVPSLLPPSISAEYAFIALRGDDKVYVIDKRKKGPSRMACNGTIVFGVPTTKGMSLLVDTGEERKLLTATESRVNAAVPSLPRDITWIAEAAIEGRYLWGDGSRCFIQTARGTRQLDVHGNVGIVRVCEGRGWALMETAANCSAVVIDLESAQIQNAQPIGSGPFADFVVSDGLLVASNGREIRSVNLL